MVKVEQIRMDINYNSKIVYNNDMTAKNNIKIKVCMKQKLIKSYTSFFFIIILKYAFFKIPKAH